MPAIVARAGEGGPTLDVSGFEDVPRLLRRGFAGGGFEITEDPRAVTLFRVYEAIEGTAECGVCLLGTTTCPFGRCIFGGETERMEKEFLDYLHRVTLADLSAKDEGGTNA